VEKIQHKQNPDRALFRKQKGKISVVVVEMRDSNCPGRESIVERKQLTWTGTESHPPAQRSDALVTPQACQQSNNALVMIFMLHHVVE